MRFFNGLGRLFFIFIPALFLSACGSMESLVDVPSQRDSARVAPYNLDLHQRSIHIFDPIDINARVTERRLEPRVDNLYLILDQSAAMKGQYRDLDLKSYARAITERFLKTMPEHLLGGGLWVLGEQAQTFALQDQRFDHLLYQKQLAGESELNVIGATNLPDAIDLIGARIKNRQDRSAILIVSRWDQIDRSVQEAVMRLRQHQLNSSDGLGDPAYGSRSIGGEAVCVFTLGVGNRLSRTQLDEPDSCGFSAAADKVAQPWDMAHFVERVLYSGPADTDRDGIFDYQDQCPNTETNRIVNRQGCPYFVTSRSESSGR